MVAGTLLYSATLRYERVSGKERETWWMTMMDSLHQKKKRYTEHEGRLEFMCAYLPQLVDASNCKKVDGTR